MQTVTKLAAVKRGTAYLANFWRAKDNPYLADLCEHVGVLASEVERLGGAGSIDIAPRPFSALPKYGSKGC